MSNVPMPAQASRACALRSSKVSSAENIARTVLSRRKRHAPSPGEALSPEGAHISGDAHGPGDALRRGSL
jgi:hypothetical protein